MAAAPAKRKEVKTKKRENCIFSFVCLTFEKVDWFLIDELDSGGLES